MVLIILQVMFVQHALFTISNYLKYVTTSSMFISLSIYNIQHIHVNINYQLVLYSTYYRYNTYHIHVYTNLVLH